MKYFNVFICLILIGALFSNCKKDEPNILLGTYSGTLTKPISTTPNFQVVITQSGENSIIVAAGGNTFICDYSSSTFNGSGGGLNINGSLNSSTGVLGISYSNGASFTGKKQ
jgi:hypothetical protein